MNLQAKYAIAQIEDILPAKYAKGREKKGEPANNANERE